MMKGRNGHGYIILPERTLINKYITGYGRSLRGTIDSSLRSEHCGVLAVLIMIESIEKAYGIEHSGKVTIYTDSMTVVQRIKEETREMNFANTDYDLWSMSMSILGKIKTSVRIEHVKAHQDEKVGPLTFEQYYNVKVDLLAKKGCDERHCEEYSDYGLPITVSLNGRSITANIQNTLYEHIAGKPLKEYLKRKFGWDEDVYEMVDWGSFRDYTKTIPITKHSNVLKYIYDWQYTKSGRGE